MILRLLIFLTISSACFAYFAGKGLPQSYEKALSWFESSAEQNYAKAQFNLGSMYANAQGTPKDLRKAYTWLLLAQRAGFQDDQGALRSLRYQMTKDQTAEAERDADVWASAHPRPATVK
jgi:TPR repeat protein